MSARTSIRLNELVGRAEIGFGQGQDFGRSVAAAFREARLERVLEIEVGTTTTAVAQVRAAGGFAIVDAFSRDYLPPELVAVRLEPDIVRPLIVAHSPGSGTPALAQRFEKILVELTQAFLAEL